MTFFVLDCSITAGWLLPSQANALSERALAILSSGEATAIVPPLWELELVNIMLVQIRGKKLNTAAALEFFSCLEALPIVKKTPTLSSPAALLSLAEQALLSSYDALYLQLAITEGIPLATRDESLIQSAKKIGALLFEDLK